MIRFRRIAIILALLISSLVFGLYLGSLIFPTPTPVAISDPLPTSLPVATPTSPPTTILIVGDIMLGRSVNLGSLKRGDFTWPFALVKDKLSQADLALGNLESPITKDCPPLDSGYKFCANEQAVTGLTFAGFDLLSLANNHATNYGQTGIEQTVSVLNSAHIKTFGLGEPVIITVHAQTFGFLSYDDLGYLDEAELVKDLQELESQVDTTIPLFHWGAEYTATASPRQVQLAHLAVESGADFVVGAHPHWVQNSELYQGKYIYYSLGNFIFDQEWSQETKHGLGLLLTYQGTELDSVVEHPVFIKDYGQAEWLSPSAQ